jgi:putative restriction endonuclease
MDVKYYDLDAGEGLRVWSQVRDAAAATVPAAPVVATAIHGGWRDATVRVRVGQGTFRAEVIHAYGRACAVTREHSLPVLEAAHIRPYAEEGVHDVTNGLALRSDLHRLFDAGYVTVDEAHRFVVSPRLREEFQNGRAYYELHGRVIELPADVSARPAPERLAWHREHVFERRSA